MMQLGSAGSVSDEAVASFFKILALLADPVRTQKIFDELASAAKDADDRIATAKELESSAQARQSELEEIYQRNITQANELRAISDSNKSYGDQLTAQAESLDKRENDLSITAAALTESTQKEHAQLDAREREINTAAQTKHEELDAREKEVSERERVALENNLAAQSAREEFESKLAKLNDRIRQEFA